MFTKANSKWKPILLYVHSRQLESKRFRKLKNLTVSSKPLKPLLQVCHKRNALVLLKAQK